MTQVAMPAAQITVAATGTGNRTRAKLESLLSDIKASTNREMQERDRLTNQAQALLNQRQECDRNLARLDVERKAVINSLREIEDSE